MRADVFVSGFATRLCEAVLIPETIRRVSNMCDGPISASAQIPSALGVVEEKSRLP
jgi:hypothetical protein